MAAAAAARAQNGTETDHLPRLILCSVVQQAGRQEEGEGAVLGLDEIMQLQK